MKIQVGIGCEEEFLYFLKSGADEFYAGISDLPGHLYGGKNFPDEKSFLKCAQKARSLGKKFYAVANEVRGDLFENTLNKSVYLVKNGADGLIVRDISLLREIKRLNLKCEIILSSLALCFNKKTLDFYADMGVTRLALPEQLEPKEAEPLIKNNRKVDVEVFLTAREYCVVLNGFCYLKKFNGECICRAGFKYDKGIFAMPRFSLAEHYLNLYEFYKAGARIIKIGRHPSKDYAKIIFKQALSVRDILYSSLSKEDFLKKALSAHEKFGEFLLKWKKRR